MNKKYINLIFLLLLLLDAGYSLKQYYHVPVDGDLAWITVPATGYQQVRKDPLALGVLLENKTYASPNRFCAHVTLSEYFKNVPNWLHLVTNPVNSIYLASALAKTGIQILVICMLAAFVCASTNIFKKDFLLAALIITPLMQASGYTGTLGVIDRATTYTFFYALPLGLLLLFFYPFYKAENRGGQFELNFFYKVCLLFLVLILFLNGPLVPAIVVLVCPAVLFFKWLKYFKASDGSSFLRKTIAAIKEMPRLYFFYFILFTVLCLYSLYIGRSDYENQNAIPLIERYKRLPFGLYHLMVDEFGFPLLLTAIGLNIGLLYKTHTDESRRIFTILKWIALFGVVYVLLLPLGGYRTYRPNIVRNDTFMPLTFALIFFYGLSTYYLIKQHGTKRKIAYIAVIVVVSLVFTIADRPVHDNDCEKQTLMEISESKEDIIQLDCNCNIMSWGKITNPDDSKWNTELLKHWGVIKEKKLYYQK